MKRWGLILDCEKEEITLDTESPHDCSQLEDETSPSNLINLTETTSPSGDHMCHIDSQEYLEQANSVFSDHESPEGERNSKVQTQTQSETTPIESNSRILDDEHEAPKPEEPPNEQEDEQETPEPEVVLETEESKEHDELIVLAESIMSKESTKSCETSKHITETELPYPSMECYGQNEGEGQYLMDEDTDFEPERTPLASEVLLLGQIPMVR